MLRSRTYDLSGGLILDTGRDDLFVSPYVGAGMALLFTDIERSGPDTPFEESDSVWAATSAAGRASASTIGVTSASMSAGCWPPMTRSTASARPPTP